tara:strand:+ start:2294 stop:2497 length:204 start_codon:yes stop_codon:yes gene_type:complete
MALWQIEISIEVQTENGDPRDWNWDELLYTWDGDKIIEVNAIQAEKSWSQEYEELSEYVGQLEGEKQ